MRLDLPVQKPEPRPDGYATYAVFMSRPDRARRRVTLQQVAARDLALVDLPPDAYELYFCDAPATGRDVLRDEINISASCYIAREIVDSAEMRERLKQSGILRGDQPVMVRRDANGNMDAGDLSHNIWLIKSSQARYHAVTRDGRDYLAIHPKDCDSVIDEHKNIMMVWREARPRMTRTGAPPSQQFGGLHLKAAPSKKFKL